MTSMCKMTRNTSALGLCLIVAAMLSFSAASASAEASRILLTADTEGNVWPGDCCGSEDGQGCLPRRATVVAEARKADAKLLLVDAGNALFGAGSLASKGKIIVVAYGALGYDAANISFRDFRLGKAATLEALKEAKFAAISANLKDSAAGKLLFDPFVVKGAEGSRVAIIGVTELPPAMAGLTHVKQQLEGIDIIPPLDALAEYLPKAKAQAQSVVLLYYGTAKGLEAVRRKYGGDLAAICVGNMRPDALPTDAKPLHAAAGEFGRNVAQVSLKGDGTGEIKLLEVSPAVKINEAMVKLLTPLKATSTAVAAAETRPAAPDERRQPASGPAAPERPGETPPLAERTASAPASFQAEAALKSLVLATPAGVEVSGQSKALNLSVSQLLLTPAQGKVNASPGGSLLVLQTEWSNRLNMPYEVPQLSSNVYLVVNDRWLAPLHAKANDVPGHIPQRVRLSATGGQAKGPLVFDLPVEKVTSLELRFVDVKYGDITLSLLRTADAPPPATPVAGPVKNSAVEMAVYNIRKDASLGNLKAPTGMTFVALDIRGSSVAKDAAGNNAMADVAHWRQYLTLIADGEYGYVPQADSTMPVKPRWVRNVATGGDVVFLVPADAKSLELRLDFPSLEKDDDGSQAVVIPLEGKVPALPERKAIHTARDEMFDVMIFSSAIVPHVMGVGASPRHKLLLLDVSVANTGKNCQWFQTYNQMHYVSKNLRELGPDALTSTLPHPGLQRIWMPAGSRRTFQLTYDIPSEDTEGSVKFIGAKQQTMFPLGTFQDLAGGQDTTTSGPAGVTASGPAGGNAREAVKVGDIQVFYPDLKPKGLEGVGLTQADVDKAVLKGRQYLLKAIKARLDSKAAWQFEQTDVLVCNALIHAGALEDPAFAKYAARMLQETRPQDITTNYIAGLHLMMGEAMGNSQAVSGRMALTHILESQGPKGLWGYESSDRTALRKMMDAIKAMPEPQGPFKIIGGQPIGATAGEALKRTTKPEMGVDGDNSVSQFSVLGLWSAARSGLAVHPSIWKQCLDATRQRQCRDGSCGYTTEANGYGSMTCAYICTTAICLDQLGLDPGRDQGIHRALAWLIQHWTVNENPEHNGQHYYYLYSIERVGRILGLDFIGPHEWYPLGAKFLLEAQNPDGSWKGKTLSDADARNATSFALLFLTKATATLQRGTEGTLKTAGPAPEGNRLYVILDASNSMNIEIDGKLKFTIAQEAVESLIKDLPEGTSVAFRVYGHRMSEAPGGVDEDSTLEIPMGTLDKRAFVKKLKSIYARGKTPLAFSMDQAAEDLAREGVSMAKPVSVVLLTDGWEDTGKHRDPLEPARKLGAIEGATLHVVAFDVTGSKEREQLTNIATAANGRCWEVGKDASLTEKLRAAAMEPPPQFVVLDAKSEKVAAGHFGQEVKLKEGKYTFKSHANGKPESLNFWINGGRTTSILYNAMKPR